MPRHLSKFNVEGAGGRDWFRDGDGDRVQSIYQSMFYKAPGCLAMKDASEPAQFT
ncbi:MAG: hypothetical protein HC878_06200 [Leptolyngbyaceae cyanobacterium SL_5_14]|nr:hypothetical protein [Leptolyngbyaceae cyanobacterium SL_5_14]